MRAQWANRPDHDVTVKYKLQLHTFSSLLLRLNVLF